MRGTSEKNGISRVEERLNWEKGKKYEILCMLKKTAEEAKNKSDYRRVLKVHVYIEFKVFFPLL